MHKQAKACCKHESLLKALTSAEEKRWCRQSSQGVFAVNHPLTQPCHRQHCFLYARRLEKTSSCNHNPNHQGQQRACWRAGRGFGVSAFGAARSNTQGTRAKQCFRPTRTRKPLGITFHAVTDCTLRPLTISPSFVLLEEFRLHTLVYCEGDLHECRSSGFASHACVYDCFPLYLALLCSAFAQNLSLCCA